MLKLMLHLVLLNKYRPHIVYIQPDCLLTTYPRHIVSSHRLYTHNPVHNFPYMHFDRRLTIYYLHKANMLQQMLRLVLPNMYPLRIVYMCFGLPPPMYRHRILS